MTSFFGIFFVLEDLRRWDELTTGPIDLYEGKIYYPAFIVAGVIISHVCFILLWIREYLITHRKFLLSKTPKPI
jgi:heme/copper-type cytochrome/quinol oxidase subunit 3